VDDDDKAERIGAAGQVWTQVLDAMRARIGGQDVDVWLKGARPVHLDGTVLIVEVANRYYADWIGENYQALLGEELSTALGRRVELRTTWRDEPTAEEPRSGVPDADLDRRPRGIGVVTGQTFESFVVGECNRFAHAAASAVADNPARNYNPLFLYGVHGPRQDPPDARDRQPGARSGRQRRGWCTSPPKTS
jgi:chromosomal replication initiator protein